MLLKALHRIFIEKWSCTWQRKDVQDVSGSLPVSASQEAGSELSIHATYDIYQQDEAEELPF